jgi:uncharacterized membrane protein
MSYTEVIENVVKAVEGVGAGIMVLGGLGAFVAFLRDASGVATRDGSYKRLRRNLGRCILLGLEVLIVADIVRTIVVAPTYESVTVLGLIVVIRILLSFSLEVEIEGFWPWNRWRDAHGVRSATSSARTDSVDPARATPIENPWGADEA